MEKENNRDESKTTKSLESIVSRRLSVIGYDFSKLNKTEKENILLAEKTWIQILDKEKNAYEILSIDKSNISYFIRGTLLKRATVYKYPVIKKYIEQCTNDSLGLKKNQEYNSLNVENDILRKLIKESLCSNVDNQELRYKLAELKEKCLKLENENSSLLQDYLKLRNKKNNN